MHIPDQTHTLHTAEPTPPVTSTSLSTSPYIVPTWVPAPCACLFCLCSLSLSFSLFLSFSLSLSLLSPSPSQQCAGAVHRGTNQASAGQPPSRAADTDMPFRGNRSVASCHIIPRSKVGRPGCHACHRSGGHRCCQGW